MNISFVQVIKSLSYKYIFFKSSILKNYEQLQRQEQDRIKY